MLVDKPGGRNMLPSEQPLLHHRSHEHESDYDQGTRYADSNVPLPDTVLALLSAELPVQQPKLHKHAAKSPWLSGFVAAD